MSGVVLLSRAMNKPLSLAPTSRWSCPCSVMFINNLPLPPSPPSSPPSLLKSSSTFSHGLGHRSVQGRSSQNFVCRATASWLTSSDFSIKEVPPPPLPVSSSSSSCVLLLLFLLSNHAPPLPPHPAANNGESHLLHRRRRRRRSSICD